MKRKILSLLLALCLVVGMMPVAASAETSDGTEQRTDKSLVSLTFSDGSVKYYETLGDAVAAVHALDTPTRMEENIITLLKDNATGGGFAVGYQSIDEGTTSGNNPANITFDLNTYTYSVSGGIGSSGTETNGFQFLKGSTVKIKNGTITSETTGFLIQNYSDLTLENVNLTATQASYVMSNNCGDVNITGNTSITAGEGKYAFDVCVTTHYPEGVTVNVNTTGTITGNIQYDSWDGTPENNQAKLNVQQGTFVGTFNIESGLENAAKENFVITGGNFADFSYEGLDEFIPDGMEQNEQGEIVIDTNTAVASVNNIGYTTLQDAIDNAGGSTITLLKDITLTEAISITKDVSIDGQKKTITAKNCVGFYIQADIDSFILKDVTLKAEPLGEGEKAGEGATGSWMGIGTYNGCYGVSKMQLTNVIIDGFSYGLYFGKNPTGSTEPLNENNVIITANNLTLQNNYIKGAYFEKLTDSTFTNCTIKNNGANPTKVQENFKTWMSGIDLNLKNGQYKNIKFEGCTFEGNGSNSGTALHIKARDDGKYGNTTALDGVTVTGCTFKDNNTSISTPIILGEKDKNNKTPINVTIQAGVSVGNDLAKNDNAFTVTFDANGGTCGVGTMVTDDDSTLNTLPSATRSGYTFAGWYLDNGTQVTISTKFTADTTVTARWNKNSTPVYPSNPDDDDDDDKPEQPEDPAFPFTDVKSTAWYYNAVKYVYENNLMAGTGDTTFDPEVSLTRAMTAQILYNLEGQPKVDEEATFADMNEAPTWSVDAIAWAQDTGVVAGMGDNEFAPNAKVTREQFAQMMYNYAKYKKYDLTKTGDLSKFPDDGSVSDWAETAMSWANGNGLINGHEDSGLIDPAGNTIRGQAASIIMNFDKNVVK